MSSVRMVIEVPTSASIRLPDENEAYSMMGLEEPPWDMDLAVLLTGFLPENSADRKQFERLNTLVMPFRHNGSPVDCSSFVRGKMRLSEKRHHPCWFTLAGLQTALALCLGDDWLQQQINGNRLEKMTGLSTFIRDTIAPKYDSARFVFWIDEVDNNAIRVLAENVLGPPVSQI